LKEHNLEPKEVSFHLDFLKFISEEFSKKVTNPEEYKISAAFTNIALLNPDVIGITYPSVQTEYFGVNIVLPIETVDKYIKPSVCSTQIVYKKGLKTLIANGGKYCDEIDIKQDINWKDQDISILTNEDQVNEYLNDQ